jgi:molybdate transport system substrate-binding protein
MAVRLGRRWLVLAMGPLLAGLPRAAVRGAPEGGADLLVFAAASLRDALDEADALYRRDSGARVTVAYAASGALARQIEAGAPADLFISADLGWMDYLEERRLIAAGTRRNLVGNGLVLVAPADAAQLVDIHPGFDLLGRLGGGRLAMGQPRSVPAGRYAEEALTALGVWDVARRHAAYAESVRAALALVASGEAPLGIVYRSDAAAAPGVRIVATFPPGLHAPIVYPIAVTAGARDPATAAAYIAFLAGPVAQAAFAKQGFALVE